MVNSIMVRITEEEANIEGITKKVADTMGGQYIITDSKYNKIVDADATMWVWFSVYFSKVGTFFTQNCLYIRSEIFSLA